MFVVQLTVAVSVLELHREVGCINSYLLLSKIQTWSCTGLFVVQLTVAVSVLELHREVGCITLSEIPTWSCTGLCVNDCCSFCTRTAQRGGLYQRFQPEVVQVCVSMTVAVSVLELHREVGCIRDSNLKLHPLCQIVEDIFRLGLLRRKCWKPDTESIPACTLVWCQ